MNQTIENEMEILWSDFEDNDVEAKLEAFERLKASLSEDDLPRLIELIRSERNDFWVRELLSEPICDLGGILYLEELLDALALNSQEGHDNDSLSFFLTEVAMAEPEACKIKLNELLGKNGFKHKETAQWLLTFCV